jgi:RecB family exonuclease
VRFLIDLTAAASSAESESAGEQALRRVLLGSRVGLTIGAFRSVERLARELGSWPAAIRERIDEWGPLADLLEDDRWAGELPAVDGMWQVWSSLPGIDEMVSDPDAAEERSAWRSLAQVLARWEERNPHGTLLEYRRLAESEDFEAEPLLSYRRPEGDRLTLTTLHQAKGLELDVVFIADAVDGVFPDLRTRDSLLGVRHLLPSVPTETAGYRSFRLQEESRLAYTAMTRARRRVVWTATERGLDDGPGRPSRFFAKIERRLGVEPGRPPGRVRIYPTSRPGDGTRPPVTAHEAEAALRRCLVDVAVPAPTRLAALRVLGEGPKWGMRSPLAFCGVEERGPNTGLIGEDLILSPSQAELYEDCPRRYALERRLRVGSDTSLHAAFGTLIHDVLESVERRAMKQGRARAAIEEALEELTEQFVPDDFGGQPFADSWLTRGENGLRHLYEQWPGESRRAVAIEHTLTAEIGGIRWTGRADRIDLSPAGIVVVDYKTSTRVPLVAEAAVSLQLGFYALAAGADSRLRKLGPVTGAEMWYPMDKAKGVTTRKFDMGLLGEVKSRLAEVAAGIRAENWTPLPGASCDRCALRRICPAWAEGGPGFA